MPLADASVIIFSVPVFVAIFARIFLKVSIIFAINAQKINTNVLGGLWPLSHLEHSTDPVRMHLDSKTPVSVWVVFNG